MRALRKTAVAVSLVALGTGGVAAFAASAGATDGLSSTLSCSTATQGGNPSLKCTAASLSSTPLHYLKVADLSSGTNFIVGNLTPCNQGGITNPSTLSFVTSGNDKYKVTVFTCAKGKDAYKVTSDGTVTVIKSSGGL